LVVYGLEDGDSDLSGRIPRGSDLNDALLAAAASLSAGAVGGPAISAEASLGVAPGASGNGTAVGRVSNASYSAPAARPHGEIRPLRFDPPAARAEALAVPAEGGSADAGSSGSGDTSGGSDLSGGGDTSSPSDDGSWDEMFPLDGSGGSGGSGGGELIVDLDIAGIGDDDEESLGGLVVKKYDGNGAPRKEIIIQP
jgi:hypothetical protein